MQLEFAAAKSDSFSNLVSFFDIFYNLLDICLSVVAPGFFFFTHAHLKTHDYLFFADFFAKPLSGALFCLSNSRSEYYSIYLLVVVYHSRYGLFLTFSDVEFRVTQCEF